MKKNCFTLITIIMLAGCASVDKYNAHLDDKIPVKKLQKDLEFAHRKLLKFHPSLYRYISKEQLDNKFDSLKISIQQPMTAKEFYFALSPVIASIKQGHCKLYPRTKKLHKNEIQKINSRGTSVLSSMTFQWIENKLLLTKNCPFDSNMVAGTEILSIDSVKPQMLREKHTPTYSSDGFNLTFKNRFFAQKFAGFFYRERGLKDSVWCCYKKGDKTDSTWLKYPSAKEKKTSKQSYADNRKNKTEASKKMIQGYDKLTQEYSKSLCFIGNDSSVALMTIRDFNKGKYKKFYASSFKTLKEKKTQTLVIDLRNNNGGNLLDCKELYSYLTDTTFRFLKPSVVSSKSSLCYNNYFSNFKTLSPVKLILVTAGIPFVLGGDLYAYLSTNKHEDGNYYYHISTRNKKASNDRFKGNVYVLINGSSFSASCVLSASLKGNNRAYFVGEETGGSYNSCVAGMMKHEKLPASGLDLSFGMLEIATPYTAVPDGYGIKPDKEIVDSEKDLTNNKDSALDWILENIRQKPKH